jgi:hypothetical protein
VHRNSNLDSLIRETEEFQRNLSHDDDIGDALRDAIMSTRAKIDQVFANRPKIPARLKHPMQ